MSSPWMLKMWLLKMTLFRENERFKICQLSCKKNNVSAVFGKMKKLKYALTFFKEKKKKYVLAFLSNDKNKRAKPGQE